MTRPVILFSAATLAPIPLLLGGAVFGGAWVYAAFFFMTLFVFALDQLIELAADDAPQGSEFPAANALAINLAVFHFFLLFTGIWALSSNAALGSSEKLALFVALGLYLGQVQNANAHELIHRTARLPNTLGKWVYITLLFGHHASAHTRVHHRYVATPDDPNTARLGESFYRYAKRAWIGSFVSGYRMETALMAARSNKSILAHPYTVYCLGAALTLVAAALLGGWLGVLFAVLLGGYAQMQLLLSDYVQHYGLLRHKLENGRYEPIGAQHSWNAPHWFSSLLMLNAPRHSDHHAHPQKTYPTLTLPTAQEAPMLPSSLPVMGCIALSPTLWRRTMDARALQWRVGPVSVPSAPKTEIAVGDAA